MCLAFKQSKPKGILPNQSKFDTKKIFNCLIIAALLCLCHWEKESIRDSSENTVVQNNITSNHRINTCWFNTKNWSRDWNKKGPKMKPRWTPELIDFEEVFVCDGFKQL